MTLLRDQRLGAERSPAARPRRDRQELHLVHIPRDTALSFRKVTRMLDPLPAATLLGLDAKLVPPRVNRGVTSPEPSARSDGVPWAWIALAVALAGLTAALLRRHVPRLPRFARG